MTRPGNNILQFARSSERGKTERIGGTVEGHGEPSAAVVPTGHSSRDENSQIGSSLGRAKQHHSEYQASPADSLWSSSHINFHHKRKNGTFINGPETMDGIAKGVILTVLLATLVGLGFWLCSEFHLAERAIVQTLK